MKLRWFLWLQKIINPPVNKRRPRAEQQQQEHQYSAADYTTGLEQVPTIQVEDKRKHTEENGAHPKKRSRAKKFRTWIKRHISKAGPDEDLEETMNKEDGEKEGSDSQPEVPSQQENYEPKGRSETSQKKDSTQQSQWGRQWWNKWMELDWTALERTQVIFTGLLTVFTILYALTTLWQFMYLIGRDRLDLRAWVVPIKVIVPPEVKEGAPLVFGVQVVNSGKTPALNMKTLVVAEVWPREWSFVPTYKGIPVSSPEQSIGTLLPAFPVTAPMGPALLRKGELGRLRNKVTILYLYGEVLYDDVFNSPHCTRFCLTYSPNESISMCGGNNEITDAQCEHIQ
jgi:hypothetical protein